MQVHDKFGIQNAVLVGILSAAYCSTLLLFLYRIF